MKKVLVALGVVVILLVGGLAGAYWWLSRPVELQAFNEGVPLETRERNSEVVSMLTAVGIDSALVDIDAQRVYLAYDLPDHPNLTGEEIQLFALMTASHYATESPVGIVVQYVEKEPFLAWEADLVKLRAVPEDATQEQWDAYMATIVRTTF